MKSGIPWSVKGIEPEVREAAKDAARRSGVTLGEWLNNAILERAESRAADRASGMHPLVKDRFSRIAEELAMMTAERPQEKVAGAFQSPPVAEPRLDAVVERIENNERYLTEALTSVNERLKALNTQIARQAELTLEGAGEAETYATLEAAVRNIVAHLDVSERRTQEAITSVREQITSFSDKSEDKIERLVVRVGERLEQQEQGSRALQAVQSQVRELSEQLGSLRSLPDALVERAKNLAVGSVQAEVKELEENVGALAVHVESSLARLDGFDSELAGLRNEMTRLKEEMGNIAYQAERVTEDTASQHDFQSLQGSIAKLSARFEELPIIGIEQRLSEAGRRISAMEIRARALPQFSDVEKRVQTLETRFAEERSPSATEQAIDQLYEQMRKFDDRLAGSEDRFTSLETIERSMSQIFQALEDGRADVQEVAEEAARRVVLELQQTRLPETAQQPVLAALEQALDGMRQQNLHSEQQTQETFDALHDTLEEIINRISDIETAQSPSERGQLGHGAIAAKPQPGVAAKTSAATSDQSFHSSAWQSSVQEHLATAQGDPGVEGDAPFDPGQQAADLARELFAPEEEVKVRPGVAKPQGPAAHEDDFIAAARRAAQAAAQGARLNVGRYPQGTGKAERALLNPFSLFTRAAPVKPRHPRGVADDIAAAADTAKVSSHGGRRRLLLAALLLLAAVSAYAVRSGYKAPPPPIPAAQSETQPQLPAGATGSVSSLQQSSEFGPTQPLAPTIAPETIRLAALSGRAEAQFVIGGRYVEGVAVAQNPGEAAKWYHKAAQQGLAPAQYRLATLFERGLGVVQSTEKRIVWYGRAAAQGNVKSMHNLGVLLAQGDSPDHGGAARWFTAAANHGVRDSQYNVAILYERGLGLKKDPAEAFFWFLAAAAQGDEDALSKAAAVENSLPPAVAAATRERLKTWQPRQAQSNANMVSLASTPG